MADLTPVALALAGVAPAPVAAAAGGDAIVKADGKAFARIINGGGGSITATVVAQQTTRPKDGTFPDMTMANQAVAVPAGASRVIGPFPPAFIDANGKVQLTYSGVTTVTIETWSFP